MTEQNMKQKTECADCWSPSERKMKGFFETIKKYLFWPIVKTCAKFGITANMVSYVSAAIGIASAVYVWYDMKISAILLLISLLLDGVDGAVARDQNPPKLPGSITDCFCDQLVISSTTIAFIATGLLDPVIGGLYLVGYPLLITFSILKNIINKPNIYVFRPRIIVYIGFWIFVIFGKNYMDYIVLPISIIILLYVIYDFYSLRKTLYE